MKKLFLLTLTLFLFGCDFVEQDTRLICDCDYESSKCDSSGGYSKSNKSLVFNESNKKFVFDNSPFDESYEIFFDKDIISAKTENEIFRIINNFNRISLVYTVILEAPTEIDTHVDGYEPSKWELLIRTVYNCKITDGV